MQVGSNNCTWSVGQVHRTINTTCLFDRGLNATCDEGAPVPGGGCGYTKTADLLQDATNPAGTNPCPSVPIKYDVQ